MNPDNAITHIDNVTADGPISVVGVAGPGDSLANEETFEFFEKLAEKHPDLIKSTAALKALMNFPTPSMDSPGRNVDDTGASAMVVSSVTR